MSEPTLLDALLDLVDAACPSFHLPTTLWFADVDPTTDPDGITLGRKEVDGHPLPHLLGFVAPPDWTVFGLTTCGWMGDLDSPLPPSRQPGRRRIRQTLLLGRSGARATVVHFADGGEPMTDVPSEGVVLDALLRCLVLPTAPPEHSTAHLFTARWLDQVVGVAGTSDDRLTWWDVAPLHPGVRMLASDGEPVGRISTSHLVDIARALSNVLDWGRLRHLAMEGKVPDVAADLAGWMDDGMFSRWLIGPLAPVVELLDEVEAVVSRSCARRVHEVVRAVCPDVANPVDGSAASGNT